MIRINLLSIPKSKRGKRTVAVPLVSGSGPNLLVVSLAVVVLTALVNLGWWYRLNSESRRIAAEMVKAEKENRDLLQVKARVEQKNKQAELYQRRVDVIDRLRAQQSGPKELLTTVGQTVNATDAVWLSKLSDDGGNVSIEGTALSIDAVANLMANLKRTGYFKNVEMRESYQDDQVRNMQAFVFTLVCEKQPQPQKS
ncbi:MAG TPA: PilN domain-containing protein [Terriglobales bacterium]|jgi:Tfp pilus assembly protein PilN|nr:PilN domain-containing protein [Terriglobales bacterium]